MTTKNSLAVFLAALCLLAGCERAARREAATDRESRMYRAAMADYTAGRLDAAIEGLEKTMAAEPANASARFQYACLMQDAKKKPLDAYCALREFILQRPGSDRTHIAKDRLRDCEKAAAEELARKHKLIGGESLEKEVVGLKERLKAAVSRQEAAEKDLVEARSRIAALSAERDRLVAMVKNVGADDAPESASAAAAQTKKDAMAILRETDDDTPAAKVAADVEKIRSEAEGEIAAGPSILPARKPEDVAKRDAEEAAKAKARAAQEEAERAKAAARPRTYVVQDGDTLYRIAVRFYGRLSAWKAIRDANKATISNDGRVRAGETIVLPELPRR